MYGIKLDFTVLVLDFTTRINSKGQLVVDAPGWTGGPDFYDGNTDPEQAIRGTMQRVGYTPVEEWFRDGGVEYDANYPGKDVLGRHFEKGMRILRKARQNFIVGG